jgi:tetratricopeptide (TPR) repeat protein
LNEAEPDYYNNRGVAYVDANQLHLARNDLETAINIDPNHSIAHANLGHILWDNGDFDGAYDHFMNSVKIQYPNFKAAPAEKLDPSPVVREGEHVTRQQGTNKYKILSIDGGGVRGLIPAMIVHELEAKVHQPIAKYENFLSFKIFYDVG